MNTIQRVLTISALAMGVALPMTGHAQSHSHSASHSGQAAAPGAASMTEGEVRKIDPDNGKVTLKHGDIKHLDMTGMTMAFPVKDKSQLTHLKPGDKVQFMVVKQGGKMVITDIQPGP